MPKSALKISTDQIKAVREQLESKLHIQLPPLKNKRSSPSTVHSNQSLAGFIDATYLSPPFSKHALLELCALAQNHSCASVCIPPYFVQFAKQALLTASVKVCSVADFPFGSSSLNIKKQMMDALINDGCDEIDLVMNYSLLKEGDVSECFDQLLSIRYQAPNHCIKVILETSYLSAQQIVQAVGMVDAAQLDYAKTSTGFSDSGASEDLIMLMHACSSARLKLKASGGIRSLRFAKQLIAAGAHRLGTSKTLELILADQQHNT